MSLTTVPGATPIPVCEELRRLAAEVPADQAVVEIGVYKGRTACWLGTGAREGAGAHVWAVDPWDLPGDRKTYLESVHGAAHREGFTKPETRQAAERHVAEAGLVETVTLVRAFSVDAAACWVGPPIGLLYVDGDHRGAAVRADFDAWRPHLAEAAVVAFDDYEPPFREVIATVNALVAEGRITPPRILHHRLAVAMVLP